MMCKGKKCIFGAVLPSTNCNYMVGSQKTDNSSSSGEIVIKGRETKVTEPKTLKHILSIIWKEYSSAKINLKCKRKYNILSLQQLR